MTTEIPGSDKFLTSSTQWAAVTTHLSAIRVPPQPPILSPFGEKEITTIQGHSPGYKMSVRDQKGKLTNVSFPEIIFEKSGFRNQILKN